MKHYFLFLQVIILHQSRQELLKNTSIKYIMSLDSFIFFSEKKKKNSKIM